MHGIHKDRDQRPCAMTGCGCKQFRTGVPGASPAPPRVVPGVVEREPLRIAANDGDDQAGTVRHREPREGVALANFAVHLNARLRALGWDAAALAEKSGFSAHITGRAVNGTAVDLGTAEKIAQLVGGYLASMIGPYMCSTCTGEPPKGFACLECGTEARAA
jgi:hypothetical protein